MDLCGHQLFDVILMDLHMPEMAGVEALTLIQRPGEPNADTPAIACMGRPYPCKSFLRIQAMEWMSWLFCLVTG